MKVVHLLLTGQPGGIEVLAQTIGLQSKHENIMYFIFRGGSIADSMRESGIPVIIANTPRFIWHQKIEAFIQYCSDEKIDVVVNHMYSPVAGFYVCALKRKLPHIKILNYLHSDVRDIVKGVKGKLLYRPLVRAMQKCCDKVIAISEFVKVAGMEAYGLPEDKIEVIYNGVDLSRFAPSAQISDKRVMELIYVGRLVPEKGVHILLKAISLLPKDMPVHVKIVGYGSEYEPLKLETEKLGICEKVTFLGKRTDVPQLLAQADYFVHPAICQEGFGITLVEAMACGIPCIASRGGAIPEIIDDGINGYIVEIGNAQALADAIIKAYENNNAEHYCKMSRNAIESAQKYNIEAMVAKLELLYV